VEGGRKLLQSFIDADLWDEACIFKSDVAFGTGIKAPVLQNQRLDSFERSGPDILGMYRP
jgi:diaminohydroxyphosphoribosylaminopyrimidine deaminase/5-amino-6-(5-phosphoribosylamino)uracil reductase